MNFNRFIKVCENDRENLRLPGPKNRKQILLILAAIVLLLMCSVKITDVSAQEKWDSKALSPISQNTTPMIEHQSLSIMYEQGNGGSDYPSISADGRFVAFYSYASNLVPDDTNETGDIFVHDRQIGETTRVSISSTGEEANGPSRYPAISGDGRYVAFRSHASNLVTDDTNGFEDIFIHDRQSGETTRVSVSSSGEQINEYPEYIAVSISDNGRFVAFDSLASNLVPYDTNDRRDVFVHDCQTRETTRVSVSSSGGQGSNYSARPSISGDGRFVAFDSDAQNLVLNDSDNNTDIFVHDRQTRETTLISRSSTGVQSDLEDLNPVISADGRYVAFHSNTRNLVPDDDNYAFDVFVHDRQTGETSIVSVSSTGEQGNSLSLNPSISGDGRFVVFYSYANNLVTDDTNGLSDIFIHDRQTREANRVFISSTNDDRLSATSAYTISADGRFVAFRAMSALVPDDTNGFYDIYVYDRLTGEITRVSVSSDTTDSDITIAHVEVTQAIQTDDPDPENQVSLIAGKPLLVRVFVTSAEDGQLVTGRMRIYDQNFENELTNTFINPQRTILATGHDWQQRREWSSGSLNFLVHPDYTKDGTPIWLEIEVEGQTQRVIQREELKFEQVSPLKILLIPIKYSGFLPEGNLSESLNLMKSMYPMAAIDMPPDNMPLDWSPPDYCDIRLSLYDYEDLANCRANHLLNQLSKLRRDEYADYDFVIGFVPSNAAPFFFDFFGGKSEIQLGNARAAIILESKSRQSTLAHEIGHLLNQRHPNSDACHSCSSSKGCFAPAGFPFPPTWPHDTCGIQDWGYDVGQNGGPKSPGIYDDLMSYCDHRWISQHTYEGILNYWSTFKPIGPTNAQFDTTFDSDGAYQISGMIFADDDAYLDPVWYLDSPVFFDNPPTGTTYCARLQDADEVALAEHCFDLYFIDFDSLEPAVTESFLIALPALSGAQRVVITKGDSILAEQMLSPNAPTVTVLSPNGVELWGADEIQTISWTAEDLDGDDLFYNVSYSADNGVSWYPLAIDLVESSLDVDTALLPGSSQALIRVAVNDGFHSAQDLSDVVFSVAPKVPTVRIATPADGSQHLAGASLWLSGSAYDLEDGSLGEDGLCWSSDLDGDLGCGDTILASLSNGQHVLTLSVVDSDANVSTASVTVNTQQCYLLLTRSMPDGMGDVLVDPLPNCSAYDDMYLADTAVTLTAQPIAGYQFSNWGSDASGAQSSTVIMMDANKDVMATFSTLTLTPPFLLFPKNNREINAGTSIFKWRPVEGATAYRMELFRPGGERLDSWKLSSTICDAVECVYKIPTHLEQEYGSYQWQVQAQAGSSASEWSSKETFVYVRLADLTPQSPLERTVTTNDRPVLSWSDAPEVVYRYQIQLWRTDGSPVVSTHAERGAICSAGTCQWTSSVSLSQGEYKWRVLAKKWPNIPRWTGVQVFQVNADGGSFIELPQDDTLASPFLMFPKNDRELNAGTSLLKWRPVAGATSYRMELYRPGGERLDVWQLSSSVCNAEECAYKIPTHWEQEYGTYRWQVRAQTDTAASAWSAREAFVYVQLAPLSALSPLAGTVTADDTPTLSWSDAPEGAYRYQVQIWRMNGSLVLDTHVDPAAICSGGACEWTSTVSLTPGEYKWRVLAKKWPNVTPWTEAQAFTVTE